MKIKTMMTAILTVTMMFCLGACKNSTDSSDLGTSTTTTTTTSTTKATTTVATTRKTTTSKATTTVTTTTTTTVATTMPTATTTAQTVATTTTAKVQTAAPTAQTQAPATNAANIATTTTAPVTMPAGVASTVFMIQDDVTLEYEPITVYYYDEKPENPTLQAYSDLAEYGILTDEIRELITADVMSYASTKYGYVKNDSLYANSTTNYNGSFHGGATNGEYRMNLYVSACLRAWGVEDADYICPSLNSNAKRFQAGVYGWVDTTAQWEIDVYGASLEDLVGCGSNVGFCFLGNNAVGGAVINPGDSVYDNGGKVYQVSFIY